jgi:hypothetical protein
MLYKQFAFSEREIQLLAQLVDGEIRKGVYIGTEHWDWPSDNRLLLDLLEQLTFKTEPRHDPNKTTPKTKPKSKKTDQEADEGQGGQYSSKSLS